MDELEWNKQLIADHYRIFWSDAPDEVLAAQLTANFVDHAFPPDTPPGIGPVIAYRRAARNAFPDMIVTIHDLVAEASRVAVRATWQGTHRSTFGGVSATGRTVQFDGMVLWRIADGRIAERWAVVDTESVMRQMTGAPQRANSLEPLPAGSAR